MNPTEINILIAILATVFGVAIRHVWGYFFLDSRALDLLDNWEDAYPKDVADSYTKGFRDGVALVDSEDAEGDTELGELLKKGYLTWQELDQLEELDMLNDLPEDVFIR